MSADVHDWLDCPNTVDIKDIKRDVHELNAAESRRAGGEAMLKWLIAISGIGSVSSLITLLTLLGTGKL